MTLFKRILTDVSAMAYLLQGTRLDTVKKFVNLVYVPECVHVHVPHVIARDGTRVIKQKVSKYFKINLISYFLRYSWLARPALNTATLHVFQWMIGLVEVSRYRKVIPPVYDISEVLSKAVHQPVPSLPNVHCTTDIWCATENKPCCPWSMQENVPWF